MVSCKTPADCEEEKAINDVSSSVVSMAASSRRLTIAGKTLASHWRQLWFTFWRLRKWRRKKAMAEGSGQNCDLL